AIVEQTERGVTILKGKGGYSNTERDILLCVVTRLEITQIKGIIEDIDSKAFVLIKTINDTSGGMIKRHATKF
ncbi:MAG TPA: YitT family protein, partial [Vampirovibrionales bacterium]